MKIKNVLRMATEVLKRDGTRSLLTLVGVFLGLLTAVLILGMGKGIIIEVQSLISAFGARNIFIVPVALKTMTGAGVSLITEFKESDIRELKSISCIDTIVGVVFGRTRVQYKDVVVSSIVFGAEAGMFEQYPGYIGIERGRVYEDGESSVAVLASDAANRIFGESILPGKKLIIQNKTFRVVGVLKKIGTATSQQDDEAIYIPLKDAQELFDMKGKIATAFVNVKVDCDVDEVKAEMETILARRRGVSVENADFTVITAKFIMDMVNQSLNVLYAGAAAVGFVASLVSATGIANTMFTSVFRRKREIGIMKAIGMKKMEIAKLFLVESVILSLIGTVSGAVVGIIVGFLLSFYGVPFAFDAFVAIIAVTAGVFVGVVSGILPAWSAASIDPIEAIRS